MNFEWTISLKKKKKKRSQDKRYLRCSIHHWNSFTACCSLSKPIINSIFLIPSLSSYVSLVGHLNIIQILLQTPHRQYESQWYFGEEMITIKTQQKEGKDNDGWNKSYLSQLLQASLSRIIWPASSLECWWDCGTFLGSPCHVLLVFDKHVNKACTVAVKSPANASLIVGLINTNSKI